MSKALDDLSKNLAGGMPRRRALMLFGGTVMAVLLGEKLPGSAYAGSVQTQCFVNTTTGTGGQNNQGNDNCQGNQNQHP
jgi:hypothetical protein